MTLNWQDADPAALQPIRATASESTEYRVLDTGYSTYMATASEAAGAVKINYNLGENIPSIGEAKAICQADWDAGTRR